MGESNLKGISYMMSAIAVLSMMDAGIKWLVMRDIPVLQIIAMRGWIITVFLLVLTVTKFDISMLATKKAKQHFLRAALGFIAPFAFFVSLRYLPLADTTAIFFCSIFFMTAGSAWFMKESVGIHRWIAIVVGFVGVLFIVRPGVGSVQIAGLLPVVGALSYAMLLLWGRKLSVTETTMSMLFYFNLVFMLIGTATLPFVWTPVLVNELLVLLGVSVLALCGYYLITRAFTVSPIAVIAPFEYTSLVWALLLGYLIWGDFPDLRAWIGILIIALSGLYIMYRERLNSKVVLK